LLCCSNQKQGGHDVGDTGWRRSRRANTLSSSPDRRHDRVHGPPFSTDPGWTEGHVALAATLLAWEDATSIVERFEVVHDLLHAALPRRRQLGHTYQGLAKAIERHGADLINRTRAMLQGHAAARGARFRTRYGFEALAADGSRFDAPRTPDNEAFLGTAGKPGTHPQLAVTTLWHMGYAMPWDWRVGPAAQPERAHLRDMLPGMPAGCLLVVDAGFTGYDLLRQIIASGRHFLVRVGGNVTLLTDGRPHERLRRVGGRVLLWRQDSDDPPLRLRLIVLGRGRKRVYLVTSITDRRALHKHAAGELYRMRWGVEVFYRQAKQTLERRKVRSACARRAVLEMHWTMVGLWLLMLMAATELAKDRVDPLRLGVAAAARTARRWIRRAHARATPTTLRRELRSCIKDEAPRNASKAARQWPHKKTQAPPRAPRLRKAARSQLQAVQRPAPTKQGA
jgi:hypothetical protein